MRNVHATAFIRWQGFQYLSKRWTAGPYFYASGQERLVHLVGEGGTLWVVTSHREEEEPRKYRLAFKLQNCRATSPPKEYREFGSYAVRAEDAVLFPENDVTATLLELRFASGRPIADPSKIGLSLLAIRELADVDVARLEEFQQRALTGQVEIPLSPSVERVVGDLPTGQAVTAWEILKRLIELHSEYGEGQASALLNMPGPPAGTSRPVDEWIADVKSLIEPSAVTRLHGRLLILGLARVDDDLGQFLDGEGFLQKVETELRDPVEHCFRPRPDAAPLHVDSPENIDRLGREVFARSLAKRIKEMWQEYREQSDSSFVLHLHGPWGSGKTTLLRLLRQELEPEQVVGGSIATRIGRIWQGSTLRHLLLRVMGKKTERMDKRTSDWVVVDFNAWRLQRLDPPWWSLLNSVYTESLTAFSANREYWHARRVRAGELGRRLFAGRKDLLVGALVFFALALLAYYPLRSRPVGSQQGLLATLKDNAEALSAVLALLGTLLTASLVMSRSLLSGSSQSAKTFVDHASSPMDLVRRHFKKLVKAIDRPILIAIDDLDRCRREYVVTLLEGIQTLFSNPRVFYVLAADRRWLQACFENSYEEFSGNVQEPGCRLGSLFLEKAVQLSVTVPRLSPEVQKAYWNYLLKPSQSVPARYEDLLEDERERFRGADTQERVFTLMKEEESDPDRRQARQQAAVEQLGTAGVETSTEYFLSPFAPLLDPNPRSMKRFVNAYALQRDLAVLGGLDIAYTDKRKKLALWTLISLRWPLLEEYLIQLASNDAAGPSDEVRSLLQSESVGNVLEGEQVNVQLDIEAVKEFAALRGSESTPGTVA